MTEIRFATEQDVDKLLAFLGQAEIKDVRLNSIYEQFLLLEHKDAIQAVIGYERVDQAGLLRSLVFSPQVTEVQLLHFLQACLEQMRQMGLHDVYLVTNSTHAIPLFQLFGFQPVDNQFVPEKISTLEHFKNSVHKEKSLVLNCQLFTHISTD